MFGNGFNNGGNSFQFGNGYSNPYSPYGYGYQQSQQQLQNAQINTNKIYVSGIEEVRQRQLPNGSDMLFLDNDKPLLYQKIVDGKGQFEVKAFTITPYLPQETAKDNSTIDLSGYAKTSDISEIRAELAQLKEQVASSKEVKNGNAKESL